MGADDRSATSRDQTTDEERHIPNLRPHRFAMESAFRQTQDAVGYATATLEVWSGTHSCANRVVRRQQYAANALWANNQACGNFSQEHMVQFGRLRERRRLSLEREVLSCRASSR